MVEGGGGRRARVPFGLPAQPGESGSAAAPLAYNLEKHLWREFALGEPRTWSSFPGGNPCAAGKSSSLGLRLFLLPGRQGGRPESELFLPGAGP